MKRLHLGSIVLVSVLVAGLAACGPPQTGGGDDDDMMTGDGGPITPGSLRITPADHSITVNGAAVSVDYKAFLVKANGSETDVTSSATFTVDHTILGSFAGARFTSSTTAGGRTTVRATADGKTGETPLTVRLETIVLGPGAPADAPTRFSGPTTGVAPMFVYPNDGTLVPPNLNVMEFHFMPGSGNGLFELTFQGAAIQLRAYFTCKTLGAGCEFTPDLMTWKTLAMAERGGAPMKYTLRAVPMAAAAGAPVGVSTMQSLSFGQDDIVGGLYYWNASPGSLKRYEFGRVGQQAENFMDAARAGATQCVGCHTLSRDGKKIAVGLDAPTPAAAFKVFDVANRTVMYARGGTVAGGMFPEGGANFFSFSPDGSQLLSSNGASIILNDANTGAIITDPLVASGAMPDWAVDGTKITYAKPGGAAFCFPGFPCGSPGIDMGSIETLVKNGTAWMPGPTLVSAGGGMNNFYPTYSPDSRHVLFNRSPTGANSFDAMDAQIWSIPASGGNPVRLAIASTGGDSWPKWAPDAQPYRGGTLMWFTFSSRRAYGLRLAANTTAQIWMAAFDPAKALNAQDPGLPAFWLPFQELGSGNHIAQWVTTVERQMCSPDIQCGPGEFCQNGRCLPRID